MHYRLRCLALLSLPLVVTAPGTAMASGRAVDHVVLISLDGLRPEFYLDERWPAPMLQQMRREGAYATGVRSVFPSVTYPAHTTLITGVAPAVHGIAYNSPFEPEGPSGRWYWEADQIRVPTLWEATRRAGLESASVFWPVSVGAPIDYNLPEIWPLDPSIDFLEPIRANAQPATLLSEVEREATGKLSQNNFSFGRLSLDEKSADIAAYLLTRYRPGLMTLHLIGVDHVQHEEGRSGASLPRAVAALDRAIARLVEAAEAAEMLSRTAFIVVGDHGFIDVHTQVAPNVWLVEAGLRATGPGYGHGWRATVHTTGSAGFVYLADPGDVDSLRQVRSVLEAHRNTDGTLFSILDRSELARLGGPTTAALGLAPESGVDISSRSEGPAVTAGSGATHGYLPDLAEVQTGFVAWGPAIPAGATLGQMRLEEIAPLIASLLNLELGQASPGLPAAWVVSPSAHSGPTPP